MNSTEAQALTRYRQAVEAMELRHHEYEELMPIWLYSVNYHRGVRFIGQVTREDLEIMNSEDNPLLQQGADAQQLYSHHLNVFDTNQRLNLMEQFMFQTSLLYVASKMELWKDVPIKSTNPGIHFVLYDWQSVSGTIYFRPKVFVRSSLVDASMLHKNLNILAAGIELKDPQLKPMSFS